MISNHHIIYIGDEDDTLGDASIDAEVITPTIPQWEATHEVPYEDL